MNRNIHTSDENVLSKLPQFSRFNENFHERQNITNPFPWLYSFWGYQKEQQK